MCHDLLCVGLKKVKCKAHAFIWRLKQLTFLTKLASLTAEIDLRSKLIDAAPP
jgi:hypothetical protein